MSKEKQIEEIIEIVKPFVSGLACGDESGACELTDCRSCKARNLANALIEKDFRKQSDGEWRPYKTPLDARQTGWICSCCSSVIYDLSNGDTDFCPNCGAKMKGGAE